MTEVVSGSTPRTSESAYWGGEIPWITPDDLSRDRSKLIARGARSITQVGYDSCSTRLVPAGTVLYSSRAPIGYAAVAANPVCTNQGFKSFVPSSALTSDYLYWFLTYATPAIRELGSGTTFPELSRAKAREIPIPVAPLAEQRRIVTALEEHLSRLDAGLASLKAAARRIEAWGDTHFLSRLGSMSAEEKTLEELCPVFVDCPHRTPRYTDEGYPALRPRDVVGGILRLQSAARVDEPEFQVQTARRAPQAGDIVYSRELSYGWAVVVPEGVDVCLSQGMVVFRPEAAVSPLFLATVLNSRIGRSQAKAAATGSAHPHINLRDIRAYRIPVPSLDAQEAILRSDHEVRAACSSLVQPIQIALRRGESLQRAILAGAFRGQLVRQDPDDQPASALLERVAAQRMAAAKPTRKRRETTWA